MADDLFASAAPRSPAAPLTVFRAELLSHGPASWEELFEGCTTLKAITFSSSIEFLLRLAERLPDMEVVFGAERILSKEHLALAQASHAVQAYGFADALVDHKALTEALARLPLIQQSTRPRLWADWFAAAGMVPAPAWQRGPRLAQFGMILSAARAGMGAAILPDIFVGEALADGSLVRIGDAVLPGPSPYALIYPARAPAPALARLERWLLGEGGRG